jgi:hypothetical protein
MIEGSLILWLLVALVTAFLAARKNRSFIGWLLIGLIIPVIGLIFVLVLPESKPLEAGSPAA